MFNLFVKRMFDHIEVSFKFFQNEESTDIVGFLTNVLWCPNARLSLTGCALAAVSVFCTYCWILFSQYPGQTIGRTTDSVPSWIARSPMATGGG